MRRILFLVLAGASATAQSPLQLDDILQQVERNYPPMLAALLERDVAQADVMQAMGKFDLVIGAQAETDRFGYYENQRLSFGFDQPLMAGGASVYGGWRDGGGDFAPYSGLLQTRSGGEWRGGVKLPLLRNRGIDDKRGNLQKARIGTRLADLSIDQQRLSVRQMAARRYWDWAAAGQRLRVAQDVLRVAEKRDADLREAAELGQIPSIEVTENQRQILQRQSAVVEAERALQQAAIELSLFYRDANGQPQLAAPTQLPRQLPETGSLTEEQLRQDMQTALTRRPEVFVGAMVEKMMIYALGRGLTSHDMPAVRTIVRSAKSQGYRFSALVLGVVTSQPFQMRQRAAALPPAQRAE